MLNFQPITADFLVENRDKLTTGDVRLCDYAVACLFMWREFYRVRAAVTNGMLVCCAGVVDPHLPPDGQGLYYSLPVGNGDFAAAVRAVIADARERNIPLRFSTVPEEYVEKLITAVGREASVDPDSTEPDYLYPIENFLSYPGKALHAHRNHVNRFLRENPDHAYAPLSAENREAAIAFLRRHHAEMDKGNAMSEEDLIRSEELLRLFDKLGVSGGVLTVNGEVAGLTVGEAIGDTLHVSVEKALTDYHGAFQFLAMSYAEQMKDEHPELLFINRQDDTGDEGLRQSKLSYKPCRLLKKCSLDFGFSDELGLYVPKEGELGFYAELLSDPETMAYNAPWFPPDGCIPFPEAERESWFSEWVGKPPERFFAYLQRKADGTFVGYVNYHHVSEPDRWEIGVIIRASERGKGYGKQGLRLLLRRAFTVDGIPALHNCFEPTRKAALAIHRAALFREIGEENGLTLLEITREEYLQRPL